MMEWLAGLDLEKAANAVVILVTGLAVGLGFRKGRQAPPSAVAATQVALQGALVDSSSIKQAAIEVANLASAIADWTEMQEKSNLATDRHRHAVDDLTEQVKEMRQVMQAKR